MRPEWGRTGVVLCINMLFLLGKDIFKKEWLARCLLGVERQREG
jgi:hypothetical protein